MWNPYSEEHEHFRKTVRQFAEKEIAPYSDEWEKAKYFPDELFKKAGQLGILGAHYPEACGGSGGDYWFSVAKAQELPRGRSAGVTMALLVQTDMATPVIADLGTPEQIDEFLKPALSGDRIAAIGVSEPGAGSDVAGIRTAARRDGGDYVLNGQKTFISNGILCDLCIVAAKTDPDPKSAHHGISLIVVEADRPGFVKGKKLKKMGMASQDTSELAFEDCRVPVANRLSEEGAGFMMLMQKLAQERLVVALGAQASAEQILADTLEYVKERRAFGKPIASFQNTKFKLAEVATKVEVGRAFADRLVQEHLAGKFLVKECSMAKLWHTDMVGEVVDECLQMFGGYGYMLEYPISRAYMDARVQRIFAGTNEIMKVIIAKQLGI